MGVGDIIGLLPLLTGVLLTLLGLDNVTNLGFVTNIETVKQNNNHNNI